MPDGERIKEVKSNGYKCLGIQQNRGKQDEGELSERILKKTKLIMKSRLNGRNKIIAIDTWTVYLMRYGAGIVKWTKRELDEIDRKTRKVMTMDKELHSTSDVVIVYVSRMEGRRGLIGCKMSVKAKENSLGWYVKHHIEPLIVAVRISNTVPSENSKPKTHNQKNLSNKIMRKD